MPGAWFAFGNVHPRLFFSPNGVPSDLSGAVTQSYAGLAAPSLWIGVLLGAAFIAVAVRLRRWRE